MWQMSRINNVKSVWCGEFVIWYRSNVSAILNIFFVFRSVTLLKSPGASSERWQTICKFEFLDPRNEHVLRMLQANNETVLDNECN